MLLTHFLLISLSTDDKLLNLDPHFCQLAASINSSDFDIRSYHCRTPRKLTASKMDPSCTIGFFCHSREEFHVLRRKTEPVSQHGVYTVYSEIRAGVMLETSIGLMQTLMGYL